MTWEHFECSPRKEFGPKATEGWIITKELITCEQQALKPKQVCGVSCRVVLLLYYKEKQVTTMDITTNLRKRGQSKTQQSLLILTTL